MTCIQLTLSFRCDDFEILHHETLSLGDGEMLLETNNLQANEPDPLRWPNPSLRPLNRVLDVVVRVPCLLLDTSTRRFTLFACFLRFDVSFALFVWLGTHYQGLSRGSYLLHDLYLIIQINNIGLVLLLPNRDGETTCAHVWPWKRGSVNSCVNDIQVACIIIIIIQLDAGKQGASMRVVWGAQIKWFLDEDDLFIRGILGFRPAMVGILILG